MKVIPTKEQELIMTSSSRVVMIEAVAGAGKTTTLAQVAAKAYNARVPASNMLGLCFTKSAKERLLDKLADEGAPRNMDVLTMEHLAQIQLDRLEKAKIIELPKLFRNNEHIKHHLVNAATKVWQDYLRQGKEITFDFAFENNNGRLEELLLILNRLKAKLATLQFYDEDEFQGDALHSLAEEFDIPVEAIEICRAYEMARQPYAGQMVWQTPVDFVPDLVHILRLSPHAIEEIQSYSLILVDEWHDVNAAEFALLQLIKRSSRLVVVGDRDQTINFSRGAEIEFSTSGFDLAFPEAARLPLTESQRFGSPLARMATRSIHPRICTSVSGSHTVIRRVLYSPSEPDSCAKLVAAQIKTLFEAEVRTTYSDIAVIVREVDQSIAIENALLEQGIAYKCDGFDTYFLLPEILMLRALLYLAANDFSALNNDPETCKRMVSALTLYLSIPIYDDKWEKDLQSENTSGRSFSWMEQATQSLVADPGNFPMFIEGVLCKSYELDSPPVARWRTKFKALVVSLKNDYQGASAEAILKRIDTELTLSDATSRAFISRARADAAARSIQNFISFANKFSHVNALQFLAELHTRQEKVGKYRSKAKTEKQIMLTTVASSKGREWQHVLIPFMQANEFPRPNRKADEKRYFYVAITRAKESLSLFEPDEAHAQLRSSLLHGPR